LGRLENDGSSLRRIYSGETFTFTTKDPKNLPLPSMELLEMQWLLQRLVAMSGAAGWPIFDDTVGDDDGWLFPDDTDYSLKKSPRMGWYRGGCRHHAGNINGYTRFFYGQVSLNGSEWTPAD
jgi:hypothetical protein